MWDGENAGFPKLFQGGQSARAAVLLATGGSVQKKNAAIEVEATKIWRSSGQPNKLAIKITA